VLRHSPLGLRHDEVVAPFSDFNVATKNTGTKKIANTVADSMPP